MKSARRHWLAALLPLVLLAGCSSLFDSAMEGKPRKPNKLVDFTPGAKLEVRWRHELGSAGDNPLQPAVEGDAVYAANAKGEVFRLDRRTGKQVWRAESGFTITGGVGIGEGLVMVGGAKGEVAAFGEDGQLRWQVKASSEVLSAPQAVNNMVVVRSGDGRIAGLSVSDGSRQWLYERATPALTVRSHAGVTIKRGIVYAGFAGGRMALLNLSSGIVLWETMVSPPRGNTELERISDVTSLPVVDDEEVCAVAFQGNIACYELAQGNPLWSRELSSDKGMALSPSYLYVTDANGVLSALSKSSGSSLWKNDDLTLRRTTAPLLVGRYVAVGDYEGYLHLMNRDDGGMAARFRADGGAIEAAPEELDGGVLVQTAGGNLYSLAIR